ncbi:MAG TPA: DNA-binding domain-containing protein [Verrucomicrobiae bacterium]|nr:DNA-binding domain-containing protein [Verrucomicrobiae bacterium]
MKPRRGKRQTLAELRALQRLMAQAVMRPLSASERMRAEWSDGRSAKQVAASFIKPNDRLTSFERLEIYNRQYWLRVMDCFAEDFCGVCALLGLKRFRDLAVAYLSNHPSRSFTLRNLGSHLIDFIGDEPRWTGSKQELALQMARLEWAHIEAFDTAAKPPVTAADLEGRDAAQIYLRLQPHITLLELGWPLDNFLIKLRENARLRGEASNAIAGDESHSTARKIRIPEQRTTRIAVHRYNNVVYYKRLQGPQYDLLLAIQNGASLEQALQTLPTTGPALPIGDWFKEWSALGWFWTPGER